MALQPLVLEPRWVHYNEPRLVVLGLAALVMALALLLGELELSRGRPLQGDKAAVLVGLLAIGSFHHIYTWIGPADKGQTVALQCLVAVIVGAVVVRAGRLGGRGRGARG